MCILHDTINGLLQSSALWEPEEKFVAKRMQLEKDTVFTSRGLPTNWRPGNTSHTGSARSYGVSSTTLIFYFSWQKNSLPLSALYTC